MLDKKGGATDTGVWQDDEVCRVCWDAGDEPLLTPCLCRGSMSQVHLTCLQSMYGNAANWKEVTCAICKHPFECLIHEARKRELSSMTVPNLERMAGSHGLKKCGSKEELADRILAFEAKERSEVTLRKVNMRAVVSEKKAELEAADTAELRQLCLNIGIREKMSKPNYVETLLTHWQQNNGIEQALQKLADEARKVALSQLTKAELRAMCQKCGEDPVSEEIMIERLIDHEARAGNFGRPVPGKSFMDDKSFVRADMPANKSIIAALFARQAIIEQREAFNAKVERILVEKRVALEALKLADLEKRCERRGLHRKKKVMTKNDRIQWLLDNSVEAGEIDKVVVAEAQRARRAELAALDKTELLSMCQQRDIDILVKEIMVAKIFWHEDWKRRHPTEVARAKREPAEASQEQPVKRSRTSIAPTPGTPRKPRRTSIAPRGGA